MDHFIFVHVLVALVVCAKTENFLNETFKAKITGFLQEICPGYGVCLNDESNFESCCGACSCAPDCDVQGNCCFPRLNTSTSVYPERLHRECLYPVTTFNDTIGIRKSFQSYYMVSSSPNDTNNTFGTCGEQKVAPWGSLYPVYSWTNRKIYKNSVCAEAHNASDWSVWNAYLSCFRTPNNGASYINELYRGFIASECHIRFEFPGNYAQIKSEMCYIHEDFIHDCGNDVASIIHKTNASRNEIIAACSSGLMSPYISGSNYFANIFCFICYGGIPTSCAPTYQSSIRDKDYLPTFTTLISSNHVHMRISEPLSDRNLTKMDLACPVNTDTNALSRNGCRKISCPTGQILSGTKTCIFLSNIWEVNEISILLNLSSNELFNVSSLSVDNLILPLSTEWDIEQLAYKVTEEEMTTRNILFLAFKRPGIPFKPIFFLKNIIKALNKPWYLVSSNQTIVSNAEIAKVTDVKSRFDEKSDSKAIEFISTYKYIYHYNMISPKRHLQITQLHFCKQVMLLPSEYIYYESTDVLLNKITNETLFNGEFTWEQSHDGVVPTICLDRSGLQKMTTSKSAKANLHRINCVVVFLVTNACLFLFSDSHILF